MNRYRLLLIAGVLTTAMATASTGVALAGSRSTASAPSIQPLTASTTAAGAAEWQPGAALTMPSISPVPSLQAETTIAADCANSVGPDGFSHATVAGTVVWTGAITIDTPCIVQLADGASLQVVNATLRTSKLFITEENPSGLKSTINILNANLSGIGDAGFQIRLAHAGSQATVTNSQMNYVLSIGISVGAVNDAAAQLAVLNSQMTSNDSRSEGIVLVSTGRGVFTTDRFAVNPTQQAALLFAQTCTQLFTVGSNKQCQES